MKHTLVALVALILSACSSYAPDAGFEIVLVKKPWLFGHGGVVDTPVKTGRTYTALSTQGILVYMQPKKFDTEMHDTMTSDGVPISFHAIVVLQVTDSVALIRNFGPNWYANTAAQEQRIQTEIQIKNAETQRKAAEEARAAADNAYRQAIGLSPEQYVQLKRIEMELKVCGDGKCTFIENSGAVPALSVR